MMQFTGRQSTEIMAKCDAAFAEAMEAFQAGDVDRGRRAKAEHDAYAALHHRLMRGLSVH